MWSGPKVRVRVKKRSRTEVSTKNQKKLFEDNCNNTSPF